MSYVVTNKCLGEQYAQCVDVCPVDCLYAGMFQKQTFMVVDPDACINCDACLLACPIGAIVATQEEDEEYAHINAVLAKKFKGNPVVIPRRPNEQPNRPGNRLIYD